MLKLNKIAVTGGLASGKSSVTQIFKKLGAYVISADEIVHWHLSHDRELIQKIGELLGPDVITDNRVNRKAVAKKVFDNLNLLKSLEQLTHPVVKEEIDRLFIHAEQEAAAPLFVVEIPVLFEAGWAPDFDAVIVVAAPEKLRRERYRGDDFDQRDPFQIPMEEKVKQADFVILNDRDLSHLEDQVENIYQELTAH